MQKVVEFQGKVFEIVPSSAECVGCHFTTTECTSVNDAVKEKYGHRCGSGIDYIYIEQVIQKQEGEKKMRVEMPKVDLEAVNELEPGVLTLARFNRRDEVETVVLDATREQVICFAACGDIETVNVDFFVENYTILRPYASGEKLVIEV